MSLILLQDNQCEERRKSLYSQFHISGRDIAAFFTDCSAGTCSWSSLDPSYGKEHMDPPTQEKLNGFYSLIDPCGIKVVVDQVLLLNYFYDDTFHD